MGAAGMKAGEGGVLEDFRARGEGKLVSGLDTSAEGLSSGDASRHLEGHRSRRPQGPGNAAALSAFLGGAADALVIPAVRTLRPFLKSRGTYLAVFILLIACAAVLLP